MQGFSTPSKSSVGGSVAYFRKVHVHMGNRASWWALVFIPEEGCGLEHTGNNDEIVLKCWKSFQTGKAQQNSSQVSTLTWVCEGPSSFMCPIRCQPMSETKGIEWKNQVNLSVGQCRLRYYLLDLWDHVVGMVAQFPNASAGGRLLIACSRGGPWASYVCRWHHHASPSSVILVKATTRWLISYT